MEILIKRVVRYLFLVSFSCAYGMFSNPNILLARRLLIRDKRVHGVLFSKENNLKEVLLGLIAQETVEIKAAQYTLTNKEIVAELLKPRSRKVHIELVVDKLSLVNGKKRITELRSKGVAIHVYPGPYLMHNKYMLFKHNMLGKSVIWTGSANLSYSGLERNYENVIVLDNQNDFAHYKTAFESLKKACKKKGKPEGLSPK